MKLSEARTILRTAAANAGDSSMYPAAQLDLSVFGIGNDLIKFTDCSFTTATLAITSGSETLPTLPTLFRAERFRSAYLDGANVSMDPWDWVDCDEPDDDPPFLRLWAVDNLVRNRKLWPDTAQPRALAFDTPTSGRFFPKADDDYTLILSWVPPFTTWTFGMAITLAHVSGGAVTSIQVIDRGSAYAAAAPAVTFSGGAGTGAAATAVRSGAGVTSFTGLPSGTGYTTAPAVLLDGVDTSDVTLNIPDDYLVEALVYGGVAMLQQTDPKRRFSAASWQKYIDFRNELALRFQGPPKRRTARRRR